MNIRTLLIALIILFNSLDSIAQFGGLTNKLDNPVTWKYEAIRISDTEADLCFYATIKKDWHLYGNYFDDGGPVKMEFMFDASPSYKLVGKVTESPDPDVVFDDIFEINVAYFHGKATFKQRIEILSEQDFMLTGEVEGQSCSDIDGKCVLVGTAFEFKLKGKPAPQTATTTTTTTQTPAGDKTTTDTPSDNLADTAKNAADTDTLSDDNQLIDSVNNDKAEVLPVSTEDNTGDGSSLWAIIFEAILWGFAALLTPCVFPMLPMTVSFFMKSGENKRKSRLMATTYGISIVTLYTIPIALIIVATYFIGGAAVTADIFNWVATHWLPNVIFFLIFMVFAASFLGAFEIVLPSWMVNKADANADKGGLVGAFFMALTLVLVSFSCTGPIVGTIIVKSTQGEIWEPIVTMFAFSAAFSLPFTLSAFFPSLLNRLPKSGGWLNSVKVVLGFIEIALGLKFLSVADQVYHWGLLDREVYIAFWVVIFFMLGLYLLGKLKFAHDSDLKFISVPRILLSIVTFAFVVYLIPGMWGAPLKALSGYLPPRATHDFDIENMIRNEVKAQTAVLSVQGTSQNAAESAICDENPKYSDFLHLPHGLEGYFDLDEAMACAKQQNKPIFIDFTGHGCVNCREMEANVWVAPGVLQRLRDDYVIVALYVDEKTNLPEDEWIKGSDGRMKKTIGKKYSDLQASRFGTNSQPYYVLLDLNGELLIQPRAYDLDVDEFADFLDKGKAEFEKRNQ